MCKNCLTEGWLLYCIFYFGWYFPGSVNVYQSATAYLLHHNIKTMSGGGGGMIWWLMAAGELWATWEIWLKISHWRPSCCHHPPAVHFLLPSANSFKKYSIDKSINWKIHLNATFFKVQFLGNSKKFIINSF